MTGKLRLEIYGLVVIMGGIILTSAFLVSRARTQGQLQQVIADAAPRHEAAKEEAVKVSASEAGNQVALAAALAALSRQRQEPLDYEKLTAMLKSQLGPGVGVTIKPPDPALPDAPSSVTFTGRDIAGVIRDRDLACQASELSLTACRKTADNDAQLLAIEKQDHAVTKDELAAAKKIASGTFWARLGRGITDAACGGGGVAAGVESGRKGSTASGVAVGAGAFVSCELFAHLRRKY